MINKLPEGFCRCCGFKNFKDGNSLCEYCFWMKMKDSKHECQKFERKP